MRKIYICLSPVCFLVLASLYSCAQQEDSIKVMDPVNFSDISIIDSFWTPRLQKHKEVTLAVCIDQIENRTGRIRNFENAANGQGEHSGIFFDDSDVYKALEGMAYSLQNCPDPELEAKCDEWIDKFAAAQQEDGYINTYYILSGLGNRWTDMDKHEMYCAGHMIEAAVAYYNVTGKKKLLDVCERMAAHMMDTFGPGKRDWVPGHEEIELALVKLFKATGKREYLEFADWLLSERGHGHGSFGDEREWPVKYYQDAVPVRELSDISGHAVRSMYLYCGMADVASYTGDRGYMDALNRVWDDTVLRNMYITGGIGQSKSNEGFTEDYDLPNLEAYCETCASVGMVLWNWRMNQLSGDGRYVDVMERSLYNGVLAGISLAGDKFFYVNPLESTGSHHRKAWYGCACCPSQLCRFLPSIGNYIYGLSKDAVWINLFIGNRSDVCDIETDYPHNGDINIKTGPVAAKRNEIRIRIPGWCKTYSIALNGKTINPEIDKGYAIVKGRFRKNDRISLHLDMPVEIVAADPRVKNDEGKRAIQRGPLVYCMEEVDNPMIESASLSGNMEITASYEPDTLCGIVKVTASDGTDTDVFIPYYAWDNREAGRMKVWIPYL